MELPLARFTVIYSFFVGGGGMNVDLQGSRSWFCTL